MPPAYFKNSPTDMVVLPRHYRWDSEDQAIEEVDIVHETIRGIKYVNKMFARQVPKLKFRVPAEELVAFRTLHQIVQGQKTPFYFLRDSENLTDVLFARKEPDFRPVNVGPGMYNGRMQSWYDYTLELTEEVSPVSIGSAAGVAGGTGPLTPESAEGPPGVATPPSIAGDAVYVAAGIGSDSNPGTEAAPYRTVPGALAGSPGKQVVVRAGVYDSVITSMPSGTSGNPIVIMAYPGETVLFQSALGADPAVCFIDLAGVSHVTFFGIIIDAAGRSNGCVRVFACSNIIFQECEMTNARFNGIALYSNSCSVLNCNIHHNGYSAVGSGGAWGYGMYLTGAANLIDRTEFHHNARYGIQGYSQEGTLANNVVSNCYVHSNTQRSNGAGIIMGGSGTILRNNLICDERGHGIEVNYSGPSGIKIYANTIFSVSEYCISIGTDSYAEDTEVINNILWMPGKSAIQDMGVGTITTTNKTTDPGFVNAAAGNFHLLAQDNGGTNLAAVTTDRDGVARLNPPDRGAYEYV